MLFRCGRQVTCYYARRGLFDAEDGVLQNGRQTQADNISCEERIPDYSTTACVECSCCFDVGVMDEE
jgi:hypothetical protein